MMIKESLLQPRQSLILISKEEEDLRQLLLSSSTNVMEEEEEVSLTLPSAISQESDSEVDLNPLLSTPQNSKSFIMPLAVICSYLISFGSHYENHLYSTLKRDIKEEMRLNNVQFHALSAIVAIPNTVIPLLAGAYIDTFGASEGSVLASFLIFAGSMVSCYGSIIGAYPILLAGRAIYGIGGGCIVTIQETILTNWFKGKWLGLAIAIQLTISRLSTFLALSITTPIKEAMGFYGLAIIISTVFCFVSFIFTLIYYLIMRNGPDTVFAKSQDTMLSRRKTVQFSRIQTFSTVFWLLLFCHALMNGAWSVFIEIFSEYINFKFPGKDLSFLTKGVNVMIVPVLVTGLFGMMLDKYGKRGEFLSLSIFSCVMGLAVLQYLTLYLHPVWGILLISLSLSLGSVSLVSSIPILVNHDGLGSALGIQKCASNVGTSLLHNAFGSIQDAQDNTYDIAIIFLISIVSLALVLSICMTICDAKSLSQSLQEPTKVIGLRYHVPPSNEGDLETLEMHINNEPLHEPCKLYGIPTTILGILFAFSWIFSFYSLLHHP